jgi:uncharacterized protein YecE (DUF72 family)
LQNQAQTTQIPEHMSRILVGTASWTDPTLIKSKKFYPPSAKSAEDRLRHYSSLFPIVEVDSTYYAMPSVTNAALWVERTPDRFLFNIKVFRLFTGHQTQLQVLPRNVQAALSDRGDKNLYYSDASAEIKDELWRQFALSLEPLRSAGKLGALLFQFPRWFIYRRTSFDHLREIRERLSDYLVAVEFRHESWFDSERHRDSTLAFEREMRFCNVVVDEPQGLPGSIPAVWEATNPELAMFRLHGRNAETWNKKGLAAASERFDYDYSEEELAGVVPQIHELATHVPAMHVIFNNNMEDQGVRGAEVIRGLLGEAE